MNQESVAVVAGNRFSELQQGPVGSRMGCDIAVQNSPASDLHHDEHVQHSESGGDGHQEISGMKKAYDMAGVKPADVNVAEVHDCFTVMGAIGTEVLGKAPLGRGAQYWVDGKARLDGDCAINTSGGLIAKGHPIGATGVAMLGWSAWQLLGKAPAPLQVKNPLAATFNIGGPICASVCTVLKAAH